jgi:NADH-quinone oxidoreductase subunit J
MMLLAQEEAATAEVVLFYVFSALTVLSALGVVISRNIVRMAVFLLGTLGGVAGLYFMLRAEFLAAVQLVVYAGGTLILIIFGVMLTSKSPFSRYQPKPGELVVALVVGSIMLVALLTGVYRATQTAIAVPLATAPAGYAVPEPLRYDAAAKVLRFEGVMSPQQRETLLSGAPADAAPYRGAIEQLYRRSQGLFPSRELEYTENYPMARLGQALLGDYLVPFEISSVLLLVVMIGAAYLAKARRRQQDEVAARAGSNGGVSREEALVGRR